MWFLLALATLSDGRALFEQNKFTEARAVLERVVQAEPGNHEARYWLGFTDLALTEYEAAILQFERIEQKYPADPEYLFAVSEAYIRRARQLSDLLSSRGENSARRHQHLAHRHLARDDTANALVELDLALQNNPALQGVNEDKVEILWGLQRTEEAAAAARAELALNANAFLANLRLGQYLLMQRQPREALGPLRLAVRFRRYPEAHQLLAYAYEKLGRQADSQGVVRAGLEVFPGHRGLFEMQKPDIVPEPFAAGPALTDQQPGRVALRTAWNTDESLFWLNKLYGERAAGLMNRLEQVAPQSARLAQAQGLSAEYDEDYAKAEQSYREALRRSHGMAGLHFCLGHVLRLQGRDEEAAAELERDVQNHLALFERALIRVKAGECQEAVPLFERTLKLAPQFADAQTELAKCFLQTSQPTKAVPLLESVISRRPDHPTAHFLLSRAYRALNQPALAQRELDIHRKRGAGGAKP